MRTSNRIGKTSLALALASLVSGGGACFTAPRVKPDITHRDPSVKIPAIKIAARSDGDSAIKQLVEDLDNDDPAVRFYAIHALEELTGETFGYRYYDDDLERADALKLWQGWLASREGASETADKDASDAKSASGHEDSDE
jgi:hypothetical protein